MHDGLKMLEARLNTPRAIVANCPVSRVDGEYDDDGQRLTAFM
jgi:hypothetical protein